MVDNGSVTPSTVISYSIPLKWLITDPSMKHRYIMPYSAKMVYYGLVHPNMPPLLVSSHYEMYHLLFHY